MSTDTVMDLQAFLGFVSCLRECGSKVLCFEAEVNAKLAKEITVFQRAEKF